MEKRGFPVTTPTQPIITGPMTAAYFMSKHAVVALSESLFHELAAREGCPVGVSVVCPELVNTRIFNAERNRPLHLKRDADEDLPEETRQVETVVSNVAPMGLDPTVLAERTLAAVREERFWVLTTADRSRTWVLTKADRPSPMVLLPGGATPDSPPANPSWKGGRSDEYDI